MTNTPKKNIWSGMLIGTGLMLALLIVVFHDPLWQTTVRLGQFLSNREALQAFINRFGIMAPFVFMVVQFLQVIFAPIPGEATGFIGGILFGALKGFVLSSVALALGSMANFLIGRFLGRKYVRKLIPEDKLNRFDMFVKRQGVLVLLILFIFPGFPKDYLCLFLGMTALPIKVFFLISAFGRMPGTLMLSLQGASLYQGDYITFAVLAGISLIAVLLVYRYRERMYVRIEKMDSRNSTVNLF